MERTSRFIGSSFVDEENNGLEMTQESADFASLLPDRPNGYMSSEHLSDTLSAIVAEQGSSF